MIVDDHPIMRLGLAKLMELRPVVSALKRQPDLVKHAARVHPILGQVFAILVTIAHFIAVIVTFAARSAALSHVDSIRRSFTSGKQDPMRTMAVSMPNLS